MPKIVVTPLKSSGMPRKRSGCKHKPKPLPPTINISLIIMLLDEVPHEGSRYDDESNPAGDLAVT
jgi:hypothetical protein